MTSIHPFLMFQGQADEAMEFYLSLFADAQIVEVERYGADEIGAKGAVKKARLELEGQTIVCIDSPVPHPFTFTPSFSLFVECESEEQIDYLASELAEDGAILVPLDSYGSSRKFAWVNDRFGVSWQLNLA